MGGLPFPGDEVEEAPWVEGLVGRSWWELGVSAVRTCRVRLGRFVVGLAGEAHADESGDSGAVPLSATPFRHMIEHLTRSRWPEDRKAGTSSSC